MSNSRKHTAPLIRIRRRDTAAVAALGSIVLLVLAAAGEIGFAEALLGAVATFALAMIYHLTISTTLPADPAQAPHASAPALQGEGELTSRTMLERLPIPVLLIAPGGRIERANPAARDFLGLSGDRGHLSAALRQPQVLEAVSAALRGETCEPVEYSMMAPIESHVRAFVAPLRVEDAGAFPWRAMLVLSDETSIKRGERMRADFLANASHELRTPLASLAGFIETLRGHARDDEGARERFLAIMNDQTERMRRLIDDLLSLSRVEMNEHLPPGGETDLTAISEDVIDALRPLLQSKSITAEIIADGPAGAVGDRDELTEVVQNLVENAIKYSPEGSNVRISVAADLGREAAESPPLSLGPEASRLTLAGPPARAGDRFAVVRIADDGQGIERRNLPRLSERFFRVDGQKSGPREGTGLGLAIVKHIVSRHRGGIAVESAPGAGSVFSVFIPALGQARRGESGANAPEAGADGGRPGFAE